MFVILVVDVDISWHAWDAPLTLDSAHGLTGEPLILGGVTEQVGSNLPFFSCLSIYFHGGFLGYSRIGTL